MAHIQLYHALFFVAIGFIMGWTIATITLLDMKCFKTTFSMKMFEYHDQISGSGFAAVQDLLIRDKTMAPLRESSVPLRVYYYSNNTWRQEGDYAEDVNKSSLMRATLHTLNGKTPIYIHNPKDDVWISRLLREAGMWEWSYVNLLIGILHKYNNSQFLDLGANLGVFSLSVAKMNKNVVAVEPLWSNTERLCASIIDGNLTDRITLIRNPLSDRHEVVSLATAKGNIGGTFVVHNKFEARRENLTLHTKVKHYTAKLDDILTLPGFVSKSVVLKIDVEGFESRVLQGGERFFKQVQVIAVFMEWLKQKQRKHRKEAKFIIDFMTRHDLVPTYPYIWIRELNIRSPESWPKDILWRRRGETTTSNHPIVYSS